MKFKINGLREAGNLEKERAVIEILEDGNVGTLIVASTKQQDEGSVSSEIKNSYWIPDQDVEKGDLIIIYTKAGKKNNRVNPTDSTSYFFYIGLDAPIYNDNDETVVVFDISDWRSLRRS